MIIRNRTTKALKGPKTTDGGAPPGKVKGDISPERATDCLSYLRHSGYLYCPTGGCTPAYGLANPSGFFPAESGRAERLGIFADNHFFYRCMRKYRKLPRMQQGEGEEDAGKNSEFS